MEKISVASKSWTNLIPINRFAAGRPRPANAELGGVELRISVFPNLAREKIVIRISIPATAALDLGSLVFEEETPAKFHQTPGAGRAD